MMPFVDLYDKASRDVGLRHVEWYETPETVDSAEQSGETRRAVRWSVVRSLTAWAASLIHPTPVPQVRRRHA
jgi:hypothetical protein